MHGVVHTLVSAYINIGVNAAGDASPAMLRLQGTVTENVPPDKIWKIN